MARKKSAAKKAREEAARAGASTATAESSSKHEAKSSAAVALFDDVDDDVVDSDFKINADYAKRFEHNKKREDLHRLQEKYKNDASLRAGSSEARDRNDDIDEDEDEDDDSSSEEEDEQAELDTPDMDVAIFRMLSKLKSKDASLYDSEAKFFDEVPEDDDELTADGKSAKHTKKEKPVTIADVHRRTLLSGKGNVEPEDDSDEEDSAHPMTNVEEERALKAAFQQAVAENDEHDASEDEDLLVKKARTSDEEMKEADAYKEFLRQQLAEAGETIEIQDDGAVADGEGFLMNYMLNRGWVEKSNGGTEVDLTDEDDSEFEERAEQFETAYNFRFEEPGAAEIVSHPRDMVSVRRKDERRKNKREAKSDKRREEARQRDEEIARLRNLKRTEIEQKLRKIEQATGRRMAFDQIDVDGDFDPDTWDTKMRQNFDDGFYDGDEDDKKPEWDDDIDIGDLGLDDSGEVVGKAKKRAVDEGNGRELDTGLSRKQREKRKRKIDDLVDASLNAEHDRVIATAKSEAISAAMHSRHQAVPDADDDLAVLPAISGPLGSTRFRYRKTEPETYGLTTEDILFADDKELNEHVGLKKLAPFRPDDRKAKDAKKYGAKKRVKQFQKQLWSNAPRWAQLEAERQAAQAAASGQHPMRKKARHSKSSGANSIAVERKSRKSR
ncbi:Kinetochore protein Spc24 [Savitreella phatthalungensis]